MRPFVIEGTCLPHLECTAETPRAQRNQMKVNQIAGAIIAAAIEVHCALGPGLLESAYGDVCVGN